MRGPLLILVYCPKMQHPMTPAWMIFEKIIKAVDKTLDPHLGLVVDLVDLGFSEAKLGSDLFVPNPSRRRGDMPRRRNAVMQKENLALPHRHAVGNDRGKVFFRFLVEISDLVFWRL